LNNERAISEEKERRRIAEYLHDGLGQNLSLVNLRLSALLNAALDPKTEKSIKETVDLVNIAINETRLLTYDLCPPILYELGLIPAISWKLSEIESKYQINTILEKITDESNISANKKILLYRVVTELLNNILKHTKADLIQVAISEIEDKFYISVIDNGAGFNDGGQGELTTKGSFGLFSIRERLDSIGGSLSIESEYFTGTKATIEIPL
jgi:signal transduction histidine kinase